MQILIIMYNISKMRRKIFTYSQAISFLMFDDNNSKKFWTIADEIKLYVEVFSRSSAQFIAFGDLSGWRTRKQLENKWQSLKRKSDQGVLDWRTVFFQTFEKFTTLLPQLQQQIREQILVQLVMKEPMLKKSHCVISLKATIEDMFSTVGKPFHIFFQKCPIVIERKMELTTSNSFTDNQECLDELKSFFQNMIYL